MTKDEQDIRDMVAAWMAANEAGDVEKVLGLMTEDAVFLLPGRAPMRKPEFAAAARAQAGPGAPRVHGNYEIQEVQVAGDWAFMWTRLRVSVTPQDGTPAMVKAGHTLTVLRRQGGRWLLARDANLLGPVEE